MVLMGKEKSNWMKKEWKKLGLNTGQRIKVKKSIKNNSVIISINNKSREAEVAKFLKIKMNFSQDSIDSLKIDGQSLFLLEKSGIEELLQLKKEEKENLKAFLSTI